MLHTFYKYNPWFKGDVLIFGIRLSGSDRELLKKFPGVEFVEIPSDLASATEPVFSARNDLKNKAPLFYTLATFSLSGYDKYIFVDGDLFFQSSILKPVKNVKGITFSPDRPAHIGRVRDRKTYKMISKPEKGVNYWQNTFNTGVFIGDDTYFTRETYQQMLKLLRPEYFVPLKRSANDQYLLNRYFEHNYTPLSARYNFRLGLAKVLRKRFVTLNNAAVIHFSGKKNPWDPEHALSEVRKQPIYLKAFKKWMKEYEDCLRMLAEKRLKG